MPPASAPGHRYGSSCGARCCRRQVPAPSPAAHCQIALAGPGGSSAYRRPCGAGSPRGRVPAARAGGRTLVREFVRSAVLSAVGLCPVTRSTSSDRPGGTGRAAGASRTLWRGSSQCAGARSSRWRSDIGTGVRAERGVVGGKSLPRRPQRIVRSPRRDRAGCRHIADLVAPVFPVRRYPQPAPAPRHRHGIAGPRPGTRTGVRPALSPHYPAPSPPGHPQIAPESPRGILRQSLAFHS